MSWRTVQNYNSHPGAPPSRSQVMILTRDRETLARSRIIVTDNSGTVSDSGWGGWGSTSVGVDWISTAMAARFGGSWTKIECFIETAAGIGRPWKLVWRMKITDGTTFAVSYTSDEEQLLKPGDSLTITIDAADGTYQQLGSAAALIIADAA